VGLALAQLRLWDRHRVALALGGALLSAVVVGIPTDLIPNPLFGRSIGVTGWAYPVWILSSLLAGLLLATDLRPGRPLTGGGLLALFAVGCPVCNKPALLLLGSAGAVSWFAPIQPALGALAVLVLAAALVVRLRRQASCPVPPPAPPAGSEAERLDAPRGRAPADPARRSRAREGAARADAN
jgi:hypothetical protein